ncbi:hypothetical protein DFH06DRAFT_1340658 [Mycena polygramma]|nr:hypothetical protein DFH06DRAFT_1340658 [Mycena polygramma]
MPQIVPIPSEEHGLLKALHPVLPSVRNIAMPRYLQSLWITHVRFLIQSIHETLSGRDISALPASLIQEVRVGVRGRPRGPVFPPAQSSDPHAPLVILLTLATILPRYPSSQVASGAALVSSLVFGILVLVELS